MPENFYDESSTKKGSSHLQRTSATHGRFAPKSSPAHVPGNLTNDQYVGFTPRKESPQNFPYQQRRNAVLHPGAQLPPPSPSLSNQCSSVPGRWTHKPTAGHSWATSQLSVDTMASGDLPMGTDNQGGSSAEKGYHHRGTNNEDHRTQHSLCQKSQRIQSHAYDELNRHSTRVSRGVSSNPSTIMLNNATPSMANLTVTPTSNSVDTGTQAHPGAHFSQSSVYPHDIHIEDVKPENVIKESELRRQLSVLRFGIFEQRRALFFCQKEAEFYYNKLTKIEDFCYQLKEAGDKSRQIMMDNILSILYESEDGCICTADLEP
ncbi:unnamed protein product [Dicrocoelium dendriticum]|nr:unnamed protein product [Dicrocoelium dendriticum]